MAYGQQLAAYQNTAQALIPKERVPAVALGAVLMHIGRADRAITAGAIMDAHQELISAQQIVGLLRSGLDRQAGGALAERLDALYAFAALELGRANLEKSRERLSALVKVLSPLVEAWEAAATATLRGSATAGGGIAG